MNTDPRAAFERLVAALEAHLVAVQQRRGEQDPAVEHAYSVLSDAFETYDEALFDAYGETTPFDLFDDEDDEDDDALDDDVDDEEEDDDDDVDEDDEDDDELDDLDETDLAFEDDDVEVDDAVEDVPDAAKKDV